jgi:signal transduction histidine kinase
MNEAFRLMFDHVKSGIVWVQRDGTVRYANKAAVQLTPCMLGRPFLDPMLDRTIKSAGQDLIRMPFLFDITTDETSPDTIRAVVLPAPVGNDLMLVLNNVSEERWYASALKNLIDYVDAEMTGPIETLVQRLPVVAELTRTNAHGKELSSLMTDASLLSSKLGKLKDLVSVFGQGAIQRDDRILVNDLVKRAMKNIQPLMQERSMNIKVSGLENELPAVYGSAVWLAKAMAEYLEYVVLNAEVGGVIELSVKALGTRVIIRSRNQGMFMSNHERRSAFVPFGAGDGHFLGRGKQNIGLALSARIVEQHGGSVRIEDDFDSVDFVMEIPAGAPAMQDAQLSVEQAQRYARDMSSLLARSMSKKSKAPAVKPSATKT